MISVKIIIEDINEDADDFANADDTDGADADGAADDGDC